MHDDDPQEAERTLLAFATTAGGREFEIGIFELATSARRWAPKTFLHA